MLDLMSNFGITLKTPAMNVRKKVLTLRKKLSSESKK
jgi:hypothetical protein